MTQRPKTITIHQPDFLPWIGFFRRWANSDLLIILDDVQFIRRGWHHRDKIKLRDKDSWLTVPVEKKGNYHKKINEIRIDNSTPWQTKHLNLITAAYRDAPEFSRIFPEIKAVYEEEALLLMDLNIRFLNYISKKLGIATPTCLASTFQVPKKGTEKLVELAKKTQGTEYLTGMGSKSYLKEDAFRKKDIHIVWDNFIPPPYPQVHSGFIANLSILDMLMMLPPDQILERYASGRH